MDPDDALTVWCGNLPNQIDEELLYELFLQVAPMKRVRIPQDKAGKFLNYGFVTFQHMCSVQYAIDMFNNVQLFDRSIIVRNRSGNPNQRTQSQPPAINQNGFGMMPFMHLPIVPMIPQPPAQHNYHGRDRSRHGQNKFSGDKPYLHHKTHRSTSRNDRKNYRY